MGLACNLVISFAAAVGSPADRMTYDINDGVNPEQVCRGAARVAAGSGKIGTKADFELTKDGITVDTAKGSVERMKDTPDPNNPTGKPLIQLKETSNSGGYLERTLSTQAVESMQAQLLKSTTTRGMTP